MANERSTERAQTRIDEPRPDTRSRHAEPTRDADQSQGRSQKPEEPSPWLREGADAPDAADIAEPKEQR